MDMLKQFEFVIEKYSQTLFVLNFQFAFKESKNTILLASFRIKYSQKDIRGHMNFLAK